MAKELSFDLHVFEELGSTSSYLLECLNAQQLDEGYAVQAHYQTAGRGRYNRKWETRSGNLALSFYLNPQNDRSYHPQLAFIIAVALAKTIESFNLLADLNVKWPNDILMDGKKCSGILIEQATQGYVVGVGVNISAAPDGFATLNAFSSKPIIREDFVQRLLNEVAINYLSWQDNGFEDTRTQWLQRAWAKDEMIHIKQRNLEFDAIFKDIDPMGALVVERVEDGEIIALTSADIFEWKKEDV